MVGGRERRVVSEIMEYSGACLEKIERGGGGVIKHK